MAHIRSREPGTAAAVLRDLAKMLNEDYHFGVLTAAQGREIRDEHCVRLKRAIKSLNDADNDEVQSILDAIGKVVQRSNPHTHSGRPVAELDEEDEQLIACLLTYRNAAIQRATITFLHDHCVNSEAIVSGVQKAWSALDKGQIVAAIELIARCDSDAVSAVVDLVSAKLLDIDKAVQTAAAACLLVHCGECGKSLAEICQAFEKADDNQLGKRILRILVEYFKTAKASPRSAARQLLRHIDKKRLQVSLRRLGPEGREVRHAISQLTRKRAAQSSKEWTRPLKITEAGMILRHAYVDGGTRKVRDAARNVMNTVRKNNPDKCKPAAGQRFVFHKSLFPTRVHDLL